MILKTLQPVNWGPFATDQLLEIEPDVTVITGANDTGKSSLLRLLNAVYLYPNHQASEGDINIDHRVNNGASDPDAEKSLAAYATFTHSSLFAAATGHQIEAGTALRLYMVLAKSAKSVALSFPHGNQFIQAGQTYPKLPRVLYFPVQTEVRDAVPLAKPNPVELNLLQIAFGQSFNAAKIAGYNRVMFAQQMNSARKRLQDATKRLLPSSMNLTLDIQPMPASQEEVMIQPVEQEYGFAPLTVRGRGLRTMVTLLGLLLDVHSSDQETLILMDEPETSLHADAQHMLRSLLEQLAKKPTVQVIYATHSPSMINNMRPHNVRLLDRVLEGERVITKISRRPTDRNFLAVRTSLGISPADSLLYAPVTIIVEGPSDALGLGMLLPKLQELQAPGFEDVDALLPQCHLVDGEGDSYFKQIPLALSQRSKAIVFLDGDKKVSSKTHTDYPDVAFISLNDKAEFEELIDRNLYFQAQDQILRRNEAFQAGDLTPAAFDSWIGEQPESVTRRAYTKRVEAWLRAETQNPIWDKPAVLKAAIALISSPSQVKTGNLLELINAIRKSLPSVS